MTKTEAIRKTEYTETELIKLAIQTAKHIYKDHRNASDDIESWDHYDALVNAYEAILEGMKG